MSSPSFAEKWGKSEKMVFSLQRGRATIAISRALWPSCLIFCFSKFMKRGFLVPPSSLALVLLLTRSKYSISCYYGKGLFTLDYDVRAKMNTELNSNEILTRVPKPFFCLGPLSSSLICSVSQRKREGKETMGAQGDVQLKNGKSCAAKYLSLSPRPFLRQSLSPPVSRVLSFSIPSPSLAT